MTKYIFVTGGVVSSLGKGITAASSEDYSKTEGTKSPSRNSIHILTSTPAP